MAYSVQVDDGGHGGYSILGHDGSVRGRFASTEAGAAMHGWLAEEYEKTKAENQRLRRDLARIWMITKDERPSHIAFSNIGAICQGRLGDLNLCEIDDLAQ